MIEGIIELVSSVVKFFISVFFALIDFIASFFVSAGETLSSFDVFVLLFVLTIEIAFWLVLWFRELVFSLFGWRKPKKVIKPLLWRPKPKLKESHCD